MDVQKCIDAYLTMFEEIFGTKVHNKVSIAMQIQSQYDSEILRRCILRIVRQSSNLAKRDQDAIDKAISLSQSTKAKQASIDDTTSKILLDDGVPRGCRT